MKKALCLLFLLTCPGWARPGLSASEARAMSQQNLTYRQVCQAPRDHVFEQWAIRPEQFTLSDLKSEAGGVWQTERKAGQALLRLPPGLCGKVLQVQLEATFLQGEMDFFTANQAGQPLEEILTYHVPGQEKDCEHSVAHRLRLKGGEALLVCLPAGSKMRLLRLVLQALN